MNRLEVILGMIDSSLETRRKRHIIGGALMSISLLFGGFALTVMSLKMEGKNE